MLSFRSGGLYSGVSLRIVLLILAFLAGAACGHFLAEIALSRNLSALGADTLELPALRAHAFGRPVSWLLRFCAPVFAFCGPFFLRPVSFILPPVCTVPPASGLHGARLACG